MDEAIQKTHDEPQIRIFSARQWEVLERHFGLSDRQGQVLQALYSGLIDNQIAAKLGMSYWTLRTHLHNLFTAFGVQDRNELILSVFRRHIPLCKTLRSLKASDAASKDSET